MDELTTALREIATSSKPEDAPIAQIMAMRARQAVAHSEREQQSDKCAECGQRTNYNGWENYETWAVHLWLTNDQDIDRLVRGTMEYARDQREAADSLKAWIEDGIYSRFAHEPPPPSYGMLADLLGYALQRVNWDHVARALRGE